VSRLQIEFLEKPKFNGIRKTIVPKEKLIIILREVEELLQKKLYRGSSSERNESMFLLYNVSSTQANWRFKTSNQSQTPQQVSQKTTFQNGFHENSSEFNSKRRLCNLDRSERCVYAYSDISKPQKNI
jgi:hypothetical protein